MIRKSCDICNEIKSSVSSRIYREYINKQYKENNLNKRIIFDTDNFVIMPSVGPVAECHLLLIPKLHVHSFALLGQNLLNEAGSILKDVSEIIKNQYGSCIAFEHGVISDDFGGSSSCNHAHMHLISSGVNLIKYLINDGLMPKRIKNIEELHSINNQKPYFYYQDNCGDLWFMEDTVKQSQYVRILLAKLHGNPQKGIWQNYIGVQEMLKMDFVLNSPLKNLEMNYIRH